MARLRAPGRGIKPRKRRSPRGERRFAYVGRIRQSAYCPKALRRLALLAAIV